MLRRKHHKSRAKKSIRSCRIHSNLLIASVHREINFCTVRFSNPVSLHFLDLLRPIKLIKIVKKTLCISSDLKHPLAEILFCDLRATALAFPIYYLFIGKSGLTRRTPVDRELLLICQTFLEHLHKDPLCPLIEFRIRRIHFPVPVIERCDLIDLMLDVLYILRRRDCRMYPHLNGIVLCWKPEGIPSHRMDDIISLLQLIPAPHIRDHIASPMSYMQTVPRRIREHIKTVILLSLAPILILLHIYRILFPVLAPFLLNSLMIVRYL